MIGVQFVWVSAPPKLTAQSGAQVETAVLLSQAQQADVKLGEDGVAASARLSGDEGREPARQHAQRLVDAGATVSHEMDEPIGWCIVVTDPEGNEFCVS